MSDLPDVKVVLVAEHASVNFGGEAILPYHYFRIMHQRGVDVRLIVHERTKQELHILLPGASERIFFINDTWFHKVFYHFGKLLPWRIEYFTTGWLSRIATQMAARRKVRDLVKNKQVNLVHQVIPVSPKEPSLLFGFGVPVVIGPMNGGMSYPGGFKSRYQIFIGRLSKAANFVALILNRLLPGKKQAGVLLIANDRTKSALPGGGFKKIINLVENGVDLNVWKIKSYKKRHEMPCNFVFIGRLVDWKGVIFLLKAVSRLKGGENFNLLVVGDGPVRLELMEFAKNEGLLESEVGNIHTGKVVFCGWKTQRECAEILENSDVLVLPSLMECGGAVVLEAMAMGLPVIATNWGGPADYLDDSCGILVDPVNPERFVDELVAAMEKLAASPELRERLGRNGMKKVHELYDWERKVDRMMEIYREVLDGGS